MTGAADAARIFCMVGGMIFLGVFADMARRWKVEPQFAASRRYARWMIYLLMVTALGEEAGHLGHDPTYRTWLNVVVVILAWVFIVQTHPARHPARTVGT